MMEKLSPEMTELLIDETSEVSSKISELILDRMNRLQSDSPALPMTFMTVTLARAFVDLITAAAFRLKITDAGKLDEVVDHIIEHIRKPTDDHLSEIVKAVREESVQ